jgi:predicted AAA+ superfamily ATPase
LGQVAPRDWQGYLMETWIAHEIRAFLDLNKVKGVLSYWRTPSGSEVDFVWNYGESYVLIEVKSSRKFNRDFLDGITSFKSTTATAHAQSYVLYSGNESLKVDDTLIISALDFLKKMWAGEIFKPLKP